MNHNGECKNNATALRLSLARRFRFILVAHGCTAGSLDSQPTAFQVERWGHLAMTSGPEPSVHHASCTMHMCLAVQFSSFRSACWMECQHPDGRKGPIEGVCVGMSEKHARNVPTVLNFETGNITAQWNVVFDN